MVKGHRKWVSGVLSAAVISSVLAFPQFSHAETKMNLEEELLNAKKRQIMRVVEEHHDEKLADYKKTRQSSVTSGARTATAATTADATEVTYTGNIQIYEFHDYFFEVKTGGTLNVETALPEEQYTITNLDTGDVYQKGEAIPAGAYSLTVFGETDTAQSYSVKISGVTFNGTPDTSLPSVDVSSPTQKETRLPKGTKTLTLEGSVTGASEADYTVNDGQPVAVALDADGKGSFSKSVTLNYGQNGISIYAENQYLNSVFEGYMVTVPGIQRIDGQDRYIVSANTGKHLPILSDTVVIARGDLFPDALSGVPLASVEGAPVLLTKPAALSTAVKDEIKRRGATRAIILGSAGAVSTNVEIELKSLGVQTIERQAGADRYETSAKIAQALVNAQKELGFATDTAIIASGQNFPDALAGSSPGGVLGAPVLLVKKDSIPATIEQFIKNNGIKNFVIVGGTGVVSASVENKLASYGGVVRLGGATRYETALEVAKHFTANGALDPSVQVVARGDNFPDALSGGPLASFMGSPIVLTTPTSLPAPVANYESQVSPDVFYIMGGTGAVSASVESKLDSYIK